MSSMPALIACDERIPADRLGASYAHCRRFVRSCSTSFYHAMRLIPEPQRSATYALYGWMRIADDLADAAGVSATTKARSIERFWGDTQAYLLGAGHDDDNVPTQPPGDAGASTLWPALRDSCRRYQLSQPLMAEFIRGQTLDLHKTRYATFEELYDYCFKVASVVGLLCIEIWGYSGDEETRRLAEWRGVAFQLTNIARDVHEDAMRGRTYLPAELTGREELSPASLIRGDGWAAGLRALDAVCRLAEAYYDASAELEQRVKPAGRACLRAMTRTYRGLLDKVVSDPGAVLRPGRVRLSRAHKVWIAVRAACE